MSFLWEIGKYVDFCLSVFYGQLPKTAWKKSIKGEYMFLSWFYNDEKSSQLKSTVWGGISVTVLGIISLIFKEGKNCYEARSVAPATVNGHSSMGSFPLWCGLSGAISEMRVGWSVLRATEVQQMSVRVRENYKQPPSGRRNWSCFYTTAKWWLTNNSLWAALAESDFCF